MDQDQTIAQLTLELCERNVQLLKTQLSLLPYLVRDAEVSVAQAAAEVARLAAPESDDDLPIIVGE